MSQGYNLMKSLFLILLLAISVIMGCASKLENIQATESIPLPFPLGIFGGAFTSHSLIKLYPECADKDNQADCYACINEIIFREGKKR